MTNSQEPNDALAGKLQAHRAAAQSILDSWTRDRSGAHRDPSRRRVGLAYASG